MKRMKWYQKRVIGFATDLCVEVRIPLIRFRSVQYGVQNHQLSYHEMIGSCTATGMNIVTGLEGVLKPWN